MKKVLPTVFTVVVIIALSILGIILGDKYLSSNQWNTLLILAVICGTSILYCFVVGELANNFSQMDKLWSILPIAYAWIIAIRGGLSIRLILNAVLISVWGIRLTINFARKGAYSIKFWEGEEDYRWAIVHKKWFKSRFSWALFDLFFISIYQNVLILAFSIPSIVYMDNVTELGIFDFLAIGFAVTFLMIEIVADEQQWHFQETKKVLLSEGKKLEELPLPYSRGFNATGLWNVMRHPNYLGEQGFWISLYLFVIGSKSSLLRYGFFHWTMIGPLVLILLFMGSSTLGESISSKKYPRYKDYQRQVFKYLPFRKYKDI